ncbi:hypothetical protein BH11ARM1_BH11ARM1_07190 [soil metagenome]
MKLLIHAMRQAGSLVSRRAIALLSLLALGALFSQPAMAVEGENVHLDFSGGNAMYLYISLGLGVLALIYGYMLSSKVLRQSAGSEKMQEVGQAIKDGALAYLQQQVRTMAIFVGVLAVVLFFLFKGMGIGPAVGVAIAFIGGVIASYAAGYAGMLMAVNGNVRTAHAALTSYKQALEVAFQSGAVAGMVTVGMGLIGASIILLIGGEKSMTYLIGFGFGGSLAALFMRVGGGIFTKAADVGADLVGKVEAGIPEDDARNPATIADNVGDNVGDCAGMAADVFESYEVTLVAAIILGAATASIFDQQTWMKLILFALMARGVGIVASIIGIAMVKGTDDLEVDPLKAIRRGFQVSAVIALVATFVLAFFMMGGRADSKIVTQSLTSPKVAQKNDVLLIQQVAKDIATNKSIEVYKVVPADILADPRVVAMGLQKRDEQYVSAAMGAKSRDLPPDVPLANYHEITQADITKGSNPVVNYAMQKPFSPGETRDPAKPYVTLGSVFGSSDAKDRYIVARIHAKVDTKAAPGQAGAPPTPASSEEYTSWVGPITKKAFDEALKKYKETPPPNATVNVEVLKEEPTKIYATEEGDFAIGVSSDVERPYTLESAISQQYPYFKQTADEMNKLVASAPPTGAAPQLPPTNNPELVVVHAQDVPWWAFGAAIGFGIVMAWIIERLTDYYVSLHGRPVQEIAGVSTAGPAPMIIQGFAYAAESSVFMVFAIVITLLFPLFLFNPAMYGGYILSFYGIALVGLGLLTTTGYVLAMDTFGPISDNAQGVYEMSGEGHGNAKGARAVQLLDAAGNTTKALTKGFAITTAVVAAVALFHSYLDSAHLGAIGLRLDIPEIFLGLLIGGAAPFLFTAFSINAVGRAAFELINEVRRQFRSDPGIMAGTSRPDYGRCVAIVTAAAQKELLGPAILAIALPVGVAFGFSIGKPLVNIDGHMYNLTGAQALGGYLAGAILSGQLMAVLLANSGGMWDNAKKLIEDGMYGGKGTDAHKASIVCDTVGDPFKDTAGPALNPLIKVMNLVALLMAPIVIQPHSTAVLVMVTVIAMVLLAISVYVSKKGSMSSAMQSAQAEGAKAEDHYNHPGMSAGTAGTVEAPKKRKIHVEEETDLEPPANPEA